MPSSNSGSQSDEPVSVRRRLDFALYEAGRRGGRVERVLLTGRDAGELARELMASGADSSPSSYRGHAIHIVPEGESRLETRVQDRPVKIAV